MANITVDTTSIIGATNRVCVRTSGDRVYVVSADGNRLQIHKGNQNGEPTSFSEVGSNVVSDRMGACSVAIDTNDDLHIISMILGTGHGATKEMRYYRFDTASDTFDVTNEVIATLDDSDGNGSFNFSWAIAVDANSDPHAIWNDETKNMGTSRETVYYDNRIGGTWGGRITVKQAADAVLSADGLDMVVGQPTNSVGADRPIIILSNIVDDTMDAFHGDALNATSFTEAADIATSSTVGGTPVSLAIDSNNDIILGFIEEVSKVPTIITHLATQATWGTWETVTVIDSSRDYDWISIAVDGTNIYAFLLGDVDFDIRLFKDEGSGFSEETADADLPNVGTFGIPHAKYATKFNNSPKELDYVFESGTTVLYNTFSVSAVTVVTKTHTTDSVLKKLDNEITHTTDSVLKKLDNEINHTTDSVLKAIDNEITHTTDSVLKALDNEITHTTDSVLKKLDNEITHTTDSVLRKIDNELTHTTDSFLIRRVELTHTTDSVLKKLDNELTHTTDSVLKMLGSNSSGCFIDKTDLEAYIKVRNNDVTDSSGNGNDGTWTGTETYATGKVPPTTNGAISLDGTNFVELDGVSEANFDREINQPFSIVFWFKGNETGVVENFVTKGINNAANPGYFIHQRAAGDTLRFNINAGSNFAVVSNGAFNDDVFHQVVVTYDGSSNRSGMRIYVDGVLNKVGTAAVITGSMLNNDEFTIGGSAGNPSVNGEEDDIMFWKRSLSPTEIRLLFQGGSPVELDDNFRNDRCHDTDSVLKKLDNEITHTTDSVLKKIDNEITHTTDSVLREIDNEITHTTDSVLVKRVEIIHTTDSVLKKLDNLRTHDTDSVLKKLDNLLTHTTDSFLVAIVEITHTTDSVLKKLDNEITHTTDSVLKKLDNLLTHTTDSFLLKIVELTHTTDSVLKKLDNLLTHTTDSVLKKLDNEITHTTDSVLKKLDNEITHTTDSVLRKLDNLITHTTDSFLAVGATVVTLTHTTDSVLKKLDNLLTHTTDSVLKALDNEITHDTDSVLKQLDNEITHTTDSVLKKTDNEITHTTDSVLKKLDNLVTHTTDSFLAVVAKVTVTHTTDSVLKKLDNTITHTTDSLIGTAVVPLPPISQGVRLPERRIEVKHIEIEFNIFGSLKIHQKIDFSIKGKLLRKIIVKLPKIQQIEKSIKNVKVSFRIVGTSKYHVKREFSVKGAKDFKKLMKAMLTVMESDILEDDL